MPRKSKDEFTYERFLDWCTEEGIVNKIFQYKRIFGRDRRSMRKLFKERQDNILWLLFEWDVTDEGFMFWLEKHKSLQKQIGKNTDE